MPKFAANISLLFAELPYLDRFPAAARAGFEAVEILFPYELAAKETQRALLANGLELLLINAPPPNYTGGMPGYAALPMGADRFQRDIRRVLRYAEVLRPGMIHIMAGYAKGDVAKDTLIRNLQWAADYAPGQQFTIEPLNSGDQPGYFLDDYNLAVEVLEAVDRKNVGLQYDAYHAQLIHGDAAKVWEAFGDRVTHVQIGAAPGRCEPGTGPVDFEQLFAAIDESGYEGWVSAEYTPSTKRTEDSLAWMG
ncbi:MULTISPECIES: hydroxypyruvate isomerase family protein [Phaeobacter]|uniref:Protein YgbM n=1 Tax=Phaeobacter piscinae TaxID=1580596 RepID=A0ABM6P9E3_9RHOB|nr:MULTISPECIES: TIM barrel protein [Phaeobacter]ATG34243.1 protein YgbM [Phaeobacter piscinae]ATG38203.1 protein YgbM [Phaeobacter piscinae]AUQ84763.1 protein YgbM [Phaeobacter piscinae]AUR22647.1 protein YgbM [Phaeobacter piscinae]KII18589.1 hydroxypyruvate isomerase [Phaeobacter sp. S60]